MTTSVVTNGKSSWVGSAKPNAVHDEPPRLRTGATTDNYTFLRSRSPVPDGDSVTSASLRMVVASGAAGSVTLTLKRVTSRVTWDELTYNNQPTVTATDAVSVVLSSPTDGTVVTFDVTTLMQTIAGGVANYGWRIESDVAVKLYGFDSANPPKLSVDSVAAPGTPTDLRPAGIGSVAKPVLLFSAPDITGEAIVQSVQAQLSTSASPAADADGTWTSPIFDSGEVSQLLPYLDLAATAYTGLAADATIYWHIRWKSGGVWSDWSDTVSYTRKTWSALTITNPTGGVVEEPTPPIIATYAPGVKRYRVQVFLASDTTEVIDSSGWLDGASATTVSWTPTVLLQDSTNYTVWFDIKDANVRTDSQLDPSYLRATATFTATFAAAVTVPILSSVAQDADLPLAKLTFTRSTAPDSFTIWRDGKVIAADLDPADLLVSGTTYSWRDTSLADPLTSHTYKVAAVVNGQRSDWSSSGSVTIKPIGLWIISSDLTSWVVVTDYPAGEGWQRNDQAELFTVIGRSTSVQITSALGAVEGTVTGVVVAGPATASSVATMADAFETIRLAQGPVTMVCEDYSGQVRLRNMLLKPHPNRKSTQDIRSVSFAFIEAP